MECRRSAASPVIHRPSPRHRHPLGPPTARWSPRVRAWLGALIAVFAIVAVAPAASPVQVEGGGATWIRIEGPLDASAQSLLRRGIETAKQRGDRLVVELDTPGGSLAVMTQIARSIERGRSEGVVVIGWVSGRALSAGALIAMVMDQLYMRTNATLGAAAVVRQGPRGIQGVGDDDPIVSEKTLSAYRAEWRAWAEQRGRPGALAAAMVDPEIEVHLVAIDGERRFVTGAEWDDLRERGVEVDRLRTVVVRGELLTVTGPEAVEYGLANGIAESPAELESKISAVGRSRFVVERTRSEALASFFASIAPVLLALGIALAWIELQQPGFGVPGALAGLCFALLLFGRYLTGLADVPHYVLIGLGVVLVLVELFVVPGTLIAGITGALCVFAGLVWSGLGPGTPFGTSLERAVLVDSARATLIWGAVGVFGGWGIARLLPRVPFLQRWLVAAGGAGAATVPFESGVGELAGARATAAQPGHLGTVLADLRPVGLVELDGLPGERIEAQVEGDLVEAGARIRVLGRRTGRLLVERAEVSP